MPFAFPPKLPAVPARHVRTVAIVGAMASAAVFSALVMGQSGPPAIKPIALSSDPLYASSTGDKPTLAMALSVEYPTVGAQYIRDNSGSNSEDPTYANTKEYLGYYDAESCYVYNDAPAETADSGLTKADYKRFDRSGPATSRKCTDAFSGNFLNWVSNSAIDMLRLSLSGGDRYIDRTDLTILQRAVLPNGDPNHFWNSSNFPAKRLQKDGSAPGTYWGAVPARMIAAANGSDIWVANTLNRIYFGTSNTGNTSGSAGSYRLSTTSTASFVTNASYSTRTGAVNAFGTRNACATENNVCSFTGRKEVLYGATGTNSSNGGWMTYVAYDNVQCDNTLGDPAPGTVKSCYIRDYTGTAPDTSTGLNSDGFFYARVQVCASDSAGNLTDTRDYAMCVRQQSGKFKPVGAIQRYSDQLRLAAFGYLMDPTASYNNGRYGGVLRAPMKYVGQRTFNTLGQENTPTGGNPAAEWDAVTGVFKSNPDNDTSQATPISGVINYLNKFGRTGPTPGRYKTYDPIGELYYETLRYMQGLDPSADAVNNLTTSMYDGFPVFTNWSGLDPFKDRSATGDYSCLKSNIVVIGDVNTHDGTRFPAANPSNNIPDIGYWTGVVQAFEKNQSTVYRDGQGVNRTTGNPNAANNDVPNSSQGRAIMGAAYWAHTQDIRGAAWSTAEKRRPGLRVKTYTFDVNEYGNSTSTYYRRNQNQLFMAAKYGGFEADPSNPGARPFNTFGNPFQDKNGTNNNDVWQKRDAAGEASSFYLQSSARGVLNAFDEIFSRSATQARSIAGSAAQGNNLVQSGSVTYQATFNTSDWSGDLLAGPILVDTSNNVSIDTTNYWEAGSKLTTRATARNIVVGLQTPTSSATATPFIWANLETALQTNLAKETPASTADSAAVAQDRLNYLRGDRSKEGNPYRVRSKLLGDIINSGVTYMGAPTTTISDAGYATFYQNNKDRTPTVFVGANDGMLHAFNATGDSTGGNELFAYIPSWMGPKLAALTSKTYAGSHQSYVDGSQAVAEARTASTGASSDFKTVLVGATGAGGRGVYALDVTNPSTFSASNVLWEFKASDDADMGFVVGKPQILKLRTNRTADSAPTFKYFAAVASGVNNYVSENGRYSATGKPALFLLDLSKPNGTAWTLGTNYFKLSLPINAATAVLNATGLINFQAALGTNAEVTDIFMGDLHGNMWKVNFSANAVNGTASWNMETLSSYTGTGSIPYPLYIAKDSLGTLQPITVSPIVARSENAKAFYVAFGTGKYLETSDRTSTAVNSVYAIYDSFDDKDADVTANAVSVVSDRSRLKAGTVNQFAGTVSVDPFIWGRARTNQSNTAIRSGWFFDMPGSGERQVSNSLLTSNLLIFGTLIPGVSGGANTCGADGGSGNEYVVNIDKGTGSVKVSAVGIMGAPLAMNVASAVTYDRKDATGRQIKTERIQVIQSGAKGQAPTTFVETKTVAGRLSWRQINNYQELKAQ